MHKLHICSSPDKQKINIYSEGYPLRLSVSSLCRGHANLLCFEFQCLRVRLPEELELKYTWRNLDDALSISVRLTEIKYDGGV
jgi:hypothetical protein